MLQNMLRQFRCLIAVILFTFPTVAGAQHVDSNGRPVIYKYVEQQPEFNGSLSEFLSGNLRYPSAARKQNKTGRVVLEFTVLPTGLVDNIQILSSSGTTSLDDEAVRVVSLMQNQPYWTPGKDHGEVVSVFFTLPITFKLD